jgi:hypothetical protein
LSRKFFFSVFSAPRKTEQSVAEPQCGIQDSRFKKKSSKNTTSHELAYCGKTLLACHSEEAQARRNLAVP